MKPYFTFVDLKNYNDAISSILPYVLENFSDSETFYNRIEKEVFIKICPKNIYDQIEMLGGTVDRILLLKVDHSFKDRANDNSIHIDSGIVKYRLNLPLMNSTTVETRFYRVKENFTATSFIVNKYGQKAFRINIDDCIEVAGTYKLTGPLIINVKEPHGVYIVGKDLPRYILSIQFKNDEILSKYIEN